MTRPSISLAFAAAAAFVLAAAPPAAADAATHGEPFRVSVPVGDLDLSAEQGRQAFAKRVRALAVRTCAPRPFPAAYDAASLRACRQAFEDAAQTALSPARGTR